MSQASPYPNLLPSAWRNGPYAFVDGEYFDEDLRGRGDDAGARLTWRLKAPVMPPLCWFPGICACCNIPNDCQMMDGGEKSSCHSPSKSFIS